jgi:hypothetical protein
MNRSSQCLSRRHQQIDAALSGGTTPHGDRLSRRLQLFNRTDRVLKMLTEDFPFLLLSNGSDNLPARLRALADDLVRIETGVGPDADELASAPLITGWRTVLSPHGLRLLGSVTGHPLLRDGASMTSQLWAADSDGRWIRSLTRFYRLGAAFHNHTSRPQSDSDGGL